MRKWSRTFSHCDLRLRQSRAKAQAAPQVIAWLRLSNGCGAASADECRLVVERGDIVVWQCWSSDETRQPLGIRAGRTAEACSGAPLKRL
jgi:hypothetical protein